MKKIVSVLLVVILLLAVGASGASAEKASFEGKIAVITNDTSQNEEEYRSAEQLVAKYGDQIYFVTWPTNFAQEKEQMISIVTKIADDPEIKAVVINQAVEGTNAAIDKLLETRDDMFIVLCAPVENPPDVAARANLIMHFDEYHMGPPMVRQAKALGAKTFVHYSFPRHLSYVGIAFRRDEIIKACEEEGLAYVERTAQDPQSDGGTPGAQQFVLDDGPKIFEEYGKDTAVFSTNCAMQAQLIRVVAENGGIYPQPCCPSPYHGFPSALGIESPEGGMPPMDYVVSETRRILAEKGVAGRLSTWPVSCSMMETVAGAEYAIRWINGEVPKEGIDEAALVECMSAYVKDVAGTEVPINLNFYQEDGVDYENFKLILMDYLTY